MNAHDEVLKGSVDSYATSTAHITATVAHARHAKRRSSPRSQRLLPQTFEGISVLVNINAPKTPLKFTGLYLEKSTTENRENVHNVTVTVCNRFCNWFINGSEGILRCSGTDACDMLLSVFHVSINV
jgi:hypothetical protein